MLAALTANMQDIFGFFLTELYTHTELYRNKIRVCVYISEDEKYQNNVKTITVLTF